MNAPDLHELTSIADETVSHLLADGLGFLAPFVEGNALEKLPASHAILMAAFAMLRQKEVHYEEHRAEWIAAQGIGRPGRDDAELARDYDWLKYLLDKAAPTMSEAEYQEAIARIVRITAV